MLDDPRIKRILKRYPKGEDISDASMDVSNLGDSELLVAFRCTEENSLAAPRQLDSHALSYLANRMGIEFESEKYDHFLHSYVRSEHVPTYYNDPSVTSKSASEDGPPAKIPIPPGMGWRSVRPKDGQESYEAWEFIENKDGPK